jgi:hypothetical protein
LKRRGTVVFLVFESLKFYKLKSENTARGLFVIVYLLFLVFSEFPLGSPVDMNALLEAMQSGNIAAYPKITQANLLFYGSLILFSIVMSYFSLMYTTCYVMEFDGFPGRKGVIASLRQLPRLLGFFLVLIVPVVISGIFLFIPLIYLYYTLFFAPALITEGKKGIFDAMIESYHVSKGYKLSIFFTQMMVTFLLNIPISLFASGFMLSGSSSTIAENLVMSFFSAARVLIIGRLIGIFYVQIIKNERRVPGVSDASQDIEDDNGNGEE